MSDKFELAKKYDISNLQEKCLDESLATHKNTTFDLFTNIEANTIFICNIQTINDLLKNIQPVGLHIIANRLILSNANLQLDEVNNSLIFFTIATNELTLEGINTLISKGKKINPIPPNASQQQKNILLHQDMHGPNLSLYATKLSGLGTLEIISEVYPQKYQASK